MQIGDSGGGGSSEDSRARAFVYWSWIRLLVATPDRSNAINRLAAPDRMPAINIVATVAAAILMPFVDAARIT